MKQTTKMTFTAEELEMLMCATNKLCVHYGDKMEGSISGYWTEKWNEAGSLWKRLYDASKKINA